MAEETKEEFIKKNKDKYEPDTCGKCEYYKNEDVRAHITISICVGYVFLYWYYGGYCFVEPRSHEEVRRNRPKCRFYKQKKE